MPAAAIALTARRALLLVSTVLLLASCGDSGAPAAAAPTTATSAGGSTASPSGTSAFPPSDCQFQLATGGGSVALDVTASMDCQSISDVLAGEDLTLTPTSGIDTSQSATCVQDFGGGIVAGVYPDANSGDPEGDAESYCADVEAAQ